MIGLVAGYSLVIEYVDLYWLVMPVYYPNGPQIHWLDFATLARHRKRVRIDVLEQVQEEQDGSGGRSAPGAEPAF